MKALVKQERIPATVGSGIIQDMDSCVVLGRDLRRCRAETFWLWLSDRRAVRLVYSRARGYDPSGTVLLDHPCDHQHGADRAAVGLAGAVFGKPAGPSSLLPASSQNCTSASIQWPLKISSWLAQHRADSDLMHRLRRKGRDPTSGARGQSEDFERGC